MILTAPMITFLEAAPAKALATTGSHGINVVPVSAINVTETCIYLYDFFMGKCAANLREGADVALAAWEGMQGLQVKGKALYLTEGEEFATAVTWAKGKFPERTLKALVVLTPKEVFDVSVGAKVITDT